MEWLNIIASILSGLAVCIPLAIKLVEYIKKAVKAKNWTVLMQLIMQLMTDAESRYDNGVARKEFVMSSIEHIKESLNYDVDMAVISTMIDSIVEATKKINVKTTKEDE